MLEVEHHDAGAFLAQPRGGVVLQLTVDGKLHSGAAGAFAAVELAHDAANGVDLDPLGPGLAAQHLFELGLDADLADLKPRNAQQRRRIGVMRKIAFRNRADISHDMRQIVAQRVMPRQAHLGGDPGQGGAVDGDARDVFPAYPVGHGHRQERRRALHLGAGPFDLFGIEIDQLAQAVEHGVDVAGVLAHHGDAIGRRIGRHGHAVAVENLAARRRDQPDVDPVFFRQKAELIGLIDLHVAHPPAQQADKPGLKPGDHEAPAAYLAGAFQRVLGRASHVILPAASSALLRARTPSSHSEASATTG